MQTRNVKYKIILWFYAVCSGCMSQRSGGTSAPRCSERQFKWMLKGCCEEMSLLQDGLRAFSQSEPQKAGIGDRIVAGPWDLRFFLEDINHHVS